MPESTTRILLFSKDRQFTDELNHRLDSFDYQLIQCESPDSLQKHDYSQYSCILADISTKALTSAHLISELNQAAIKLPPIFYISDDDSISKRLAAVQANGQGFFVKRRDNEHLYELLFGLNRGELADARRVLIFEENKANALKLSNCLSTEGLQSQLVSDHEDLLNQFREFTPDLVLLNLDTELVDGLELLQLVRQLNEAKNIPIVGLSSSKESEHVNSAYCLGCDVVLKAPYSDEAIAKICAAKVHQSQLNTADLSKDVVTSLMSHAQVLQHLEKDLLRSQRTQSPMAIALVDIDQFKLVNDTYGHMYGDLIIKNLSKLLSLRVRNSDLVGRYGGEEFLVLLYDCDQENAFNILDDIRCRFELMSHTLADHTLQCTFSAGIACFPENQSVNDIIKSADAALYHAKKSGRNQIKTA